VRKGSTRDVQRRQKTWCRPAEDAPNKATRDIKATAACYTVEAVHELAKLAE